MDPNVVTAIATSLMAVLALAALIVAMRQLSASNKEAQVQHLLSLSQQFYQEPMVHFRQCAAKSAQDGEVDTTEMWEVLNFFEGVGLLTKRGYLNATDVWELFSYVVFPLHATTKDLIAEYRHDDVNTLTNLGDLFVRLQKIERKKGGRCDFQTDDDLEKFWREEAKIIVGSPAKTRSRRKKKHMEGSLQTEMSVGPEGK